MFEERSLPLCFFPLFPPEAMFRHCRAVMEGLVCPLMASLRTPQVELLSRLADRCFPEDTRLYCLRETLKITPEYEALMKFQTHLFNLNLPLVEDPELVKASIEMFVQGVASFPKSLPFSSMVLAFLSKNKPCIAAQREPLLAIVNKLQTFVKRTALQALG